MTAERLKAMVEAAGAQWLGLQRAEDRTLVLFRDPETHSTCSLYSFACRDEEDVRLALKAKRDLFLLDKTTPIQ